MKLLKAQDNNIKINDVSEEKKQIFYLVLDILKKDKKIKEDIQKIFFMDCIDKKIIYKYLSYIWMYIDDKKKCLNCPGLEKCKKTSPYYPHYNLMLSFDRKFVYQFLMPCNKKNEEIEKNAPFIFDKLIYLGPFRDFPFNMISLKINDLDVSKERLALFKKCSNILTSNKSKWIFICGTFSSGKTYVSVAILNDLLAMSKKLKESAVFLNFTKRIEELQNLFFNNQEEFQKIISLYSNVDMVVFDNFGDEYKSEFIRDKIIWPILLSRSEKNIITIFNSRFNYDELAEMYSFKDKVRKKHFKELFLKFCGEPFDISTKVYI